MPSGLDAEWRHHDLSTPVLGALSLYAVEAAASLLHHNGDIDAVAFAAATGATVASWANSKHFWLAVYLTVTTIVTLAWILYAEHAGPFTARALTGFAAGAVVLGLLYPAAEFIDRRDKRLTDERLAQKGERSAKRGDWEATFTLLGIPSVELVADSEFRAGRTIELRLPAHGRYTFTRISPLAERLETLLDLPHGSARFRPGLTARTFHLDIHTRDVLAETLPFVPDLSPASVNDKFSVGLDEFGESIDALIREITALIFAPKRSGKSNLINVLIANLLRCVDVVIWMIDLKGGRTAKPWLEPWLEGRTDRPALDWVATTPAEAKLMLTSLKTAIDHRSITGQGEKITPSARQPAIILISDETASVSGLRAELGRVLANLLVDIIGRGGSEAVEAILAYLRSDVSSTGTSDIKAQSLLRFALGAGSAADGTSALDAAGAGSQVARLKHKGSMVVKGGTEAERVGKAWRIEYEAIPGISEAYSDWRPGVEDDLEVVLGDPYAQRWDLARCGHLYTPERQAELGYDAAAAAARASTATVAERPVPASLPSIPPPPANAQPAYRTTQGAPIARKLDDGQVEEMFAGLSGQLAEALGSVRVGPERMLALVRAAGTAGISPRELTEALNREGIEVGRQAVHDWLSEEIVGGRIIRRDRGVYVAAEHA